MKLVKPSILYKDSFINAAREIISEGHASFLRDSYNENNFEEYCEAMNNLALGIGLSEGRVSESILWLVDDDCNFLGRTSIRHDLNDHLFTFGGHIGYIIAPQFRHKGYGTKILALSLIEARHLGFEKVLVTCDNTNEYSARIIEKNGGIFENQIYDEPTDIWKCRYWIDLKD